MFDDDLTVSETRKTSELVTLKPKTDKSWGQCVMMNWAPIALRWWSLGAAGSEAFPLSPGLLSLLSHSLSLAGMATSQHTHK